MDFGFGTFLGKLVDGGRALIAQKMLQDFLVAHPATWIAAGCLLGLLAIPVASIVRRGPTASFDANSFTGRVLVAVFAVGFLVGLVWLGAGATGKALGRHSNSAQAPVVS